MTIILRHQGQIKTADLTTDHAASSYGRSALAAAGYTIPLDHHRTERR